MASVSKLIKLERVSHAMVDEFDEIEVISRGLNSEQMAVFRERIARLEVQVKEHAKTTEALAKDFQRYRNFTLRDMRHKRVYMPGEHTDGSDFVIPNTDPASIVSQFYYDMTETPTVRVAPPATRSHYQDAVAEKIEQTERANTTAGFDDAYDRVMAESDQEEEEDQGGSSSSVATTTTAVHVKQEQD